MNIALRAALIASLLFLDSCASPAKKSQAIDIGDTKAQVIEMMGAPLDRQIKGPAEALQYASIAAMGICEYTIIWLNEAKVVGINTYRNNSTMGCNVGIKEINWQQAPSAIIEIRER